MARKIIREFIDTRFKEIEEEKEEELEETLDEEELNENGEGENFEEFISGGNSGGGISALTPNPTPVASAPITNIEETVDEARRREGENPEQAVVYNMPQYSGKYDSGKYGDGTEDKEMPGRIEGGRMPRFETGFEARERSFARAPKEVWETEDKRREREEGQYKVSIETVREESRGLPFTRRRRERLR